MLRKVFIVSICLVVSIVAAQVVFVLISSVALIRRPSESDVFSEIILIVAISLGTVSGVTCFMKLYRMLSPKLLDT